MSGAKSLFYDFHLHSCLSPCGDADMTPNNIINMAKLKGLDVIAITDHNACGNCRPAMEAGRKAGLVVLPGMELCTSEDIHVVCLFTMLDGALAFEQEIKKTMPQVKNRPEIFGEQLLLDENDNDCGREDNLLIVASGVSVDAVLGLCRAYGGTAMPAHADKTANGIIGILGAIPPEAGFKTAELSKNCDEQVFIAANPSLCGLRIFRDSDAHYLWDISEPHNKLSLKENLAAAADVSLPEAIIRAIDGKS
jgi:3',5'-nucleoside bisphosphate phosphatase